ncbi:MAG: hypothetical protein V8T46_11085 [Sutterella seckii]
MQLQGVLLPDFWKFTKLFLVSKPVHLIPDASVPAGFPGHRMMGHAFNQKPPGGGRRKKK